MSLRLARDKKYQTHENPETNEPFCYATYVPCRAYESCFAEAFAI